MLLFIVVVGVYNVLPRWLHSVLVCTRSLTELLEVLLAVVMVVVVRVLVLMYKVVVETRLFFWLVLPLQIVVL